MSEVAASGCCFAVIDKRQQRAILVEEVIPLDATDGSLCRAPGFTGPSSSGVAFVLAPVLPAIVALLTDQEQPSGAAARGGCHPSHDAPAVEAPALSLSRLAAASGPAVALIWWLAQVS